MAALEHLQEAERPVIVAGGGVRASGAARRTGRARRGAADPGRDLAQRQGRDPRQCIRCRSASSAPIRARAPTGWSTAPISSASSARETGGMTTHFWAVPKIGTPAIQIDIDPEALGRNYPLLAGVNGDAKVDAGAHARGAPTAPAPASARPGSRRRRRSARNGRRSTSRCSTSDAVPIRPERICAELTRHVPDDGIVVVDTGHARHVDGRHVRPRAARRRAICAAPAISAGRSRPGSAPSAACPDRPVVTFTGDAGFWYHIAEIETAARWKHQRRDRGQQQRRRQPVASAASTASMAARRPSRRARCGPSASVNFARIAEDMGAVGIRVEKPGDLGPAIEQALEGQPAGDHRRRHRHRRAGAAGGELRLALR